MRRSRSANIRLGALALGILLSGPALGQQHVPSPEWRDQILYSLMIDRFDDGDQARNDQGHGEYQPRSNAHFNGGDLKGVTRRIPYLKRLGVTGVWVSPPTATQWWDPATRYTGYHGYWPVNFREVDAHFGSLADYKALADGLHANGMYLIQDAVVNQIGHYYNYAGGHDPRDPNANFHLNTGAIPPAPTMYPFNLIDRRDPVAARANVYHWTPSITDYDDPATRYTHQLQLMNDINTGNPLVRAALKDAYGYWVREVGVDGFRLDASKHVEPAFWRDFLHGPGGIVETARSTGRADLLTFGEIFNFSDPLATNGEEQIGAYLGTPEAPLLGAVINFPLYEEVQRVFAGGMPTEYLGFRLAAQARLFADPRLAPTFVDNHDVQRFTAGGSMEAYALAYTLIMTAPGIPVVYQGDEQALDDPRQAMFAGGYLAKGDAFDETSPTFRLLASLIALRKQEAALRRGTTTVLRTNPAGAGVFAFKREHVGKAVYVILNSSGTHATLLNALPTGSGALEVLYARNIAAAAMPDAAGRLTLELPPHAALVLKGPTAAPQGPGGGRPTLTVDRATGGAPLASDERLCGHGAVAGEALKLIVDGDLGGARSLAADAGGRWCTLLPSVSLEGAPATAEVYSPARRVATPPIAYRSVGSITYSASLADPAGDDRGPVGRYTLLTDDPAHRAADIRGASVRVNDRILELAIDVGEIKNVWSTINKFDHVAWTVFIAPGDGGGGSAVLPMLNAVMPEGARWRVSHRLFGMGSTVYAADGASADRFGRRIDMRPTFAVDAARRRVTIRYDRAALGLASWAGATLYVTSWDADEFGAYRPLAPEAGPDRLGGGDPVSPRILDDIAITVPRGS